MTVRFAVLAVLAACSAAAQRTPWAVANVDWSRPPGVESARFAAPTIGELVLRDGIHVLVVENHRLPIVTLATIHTAAGSREDGATPGLAALVVDLLDEGAGTRSRDELAAALERAGARLELATATDYAAAVLVGVSDHFGEAALLLADAVRRPLLTYADFVRVRAAHTAAIAAQRDLARTVAAQAFDRVVFGDHPYAHPATGTAAGLAGLTAADARAFWKRSFTPATTTIVLAGDVTPELARRVLDAAFGDWTDADTTAPARAAPPPPTSTAPVLAYLDAPGAARSVILIGRLAPPATDPHRLAADLASTIVGGGPGSRLERELRDHLGLGAGATASFWRGTSAGTWAITETVPTAGTHDAIRATLETVERLRTSDADSAELSRARSQIERGVADAFETTEGTVRALVRVVAQGLPRDHYATLSARLAATTAAQARAAIETAWTDLSIVVVGDWAAIRDSVRDLGRPVVELR